MITLRLPKFALVSTLLALWVLSALGCSPPTRVPLTPTPVSTSLPATPSITPTTAPPTRTSGQLAMELDSFFDKFRKASSFSAFVLIAQNREMLYEKSFGETPLTSKVPLTSGSKFRIASVSKQFTAAAILKLQAAGKLNVQDRVCKYLKPCPNGWEEITLHHLLTHTSGIPREYKSPQEPDFYQKSHTPEELVAKFGALPLGFEPGTEFSYGNGGYIALAAIIEQVSSETYETFLRQNFFAPLEMQDTGATIDDAALAGDPTLYDLSNYVGGGNLYSTVQDLYRWAKQLDIWQRDPNSGYQAMFQSQTAPDTNGESYGYGLWLGQVSDQHRIGHGGLLSDDNGAGYGALVERYPDNGLTIIILSNRSSPPDELGPMLAKIVLGVK